MDNFLILRAGPHFRLGAGIGMKQEADMFSSLCGFLQAHDLLATSIELPLGGWDGFELRAFDVSSNGLAVMKCGLDRWMRALDKGKPVGDVAILEKCLDKVRKAAAT